MVKIFLKIIIAYFIFGMCFMSTATNYYVATWGNDSWSGLSWDSAFATLQHAADIVNQGDSVFTANGDYTGFDLRSGGTQLAPIVFKANGSSVQIVNQNPVTPDGINIENADWVVIDGFEVIGITRAGIRVAVSQHVTVRNNYCSTNGRWGIFTGFADYAVIENNECCYSQQEHGIYFSNSADHPVISHNVSHHNNANGIHMNGDASMGGDGLITDATVECNIIYENGAAGGSGINCDGVAESRIYNNLLYSNHASGISLYMIDGSAGSYRNKVYNNTILNASNARWCVNINSGSYGDTLYNNILINLHDWRGSISIDSSSMPGFCSDYNVVIDRFSTDWGNTVITLAEWQALGYDLHSMLADPLDSIFVNYAAGDYHLRTFCQAMDAGTSAVFPLVLFDLEGISRPQGPEYDIGCYEVYQGKIEEEKVSGPEKANNAGIRICKDKITFEGVEHGTIISIYDLSGSLVHKTGRLYSSFYVTRQPMSGGVYFCRLETPDRTCIDKVLLLK
ncbi:MAG TPA: right-handed parallel beta-helix repeat-containing protein [bacterium]